MMPGQAIVSRRDAVLYSSDNITSRHLINSIAVRIYNWLALKRSEICIELKNVSGSIGYVGMQVMKGRVIIIDNEVTEKMIVKEKYVLARTHNVELVPYSQQTWNQESRSSVGLKQIKSKKLDTDAIITQTVQEILKVNSEDEKSMAEQFQELLKPSQELVFLQSQSNFIEKTLGANEKMKIRPECIVAFSQSISIQRDIGQGGILQSFSSRGKFVNVTGPGLLYIDMQVGNRFFKKDQMSLFAVVLYFMLYFLMFLIMTFSRDLDRLQQQPN
eukprot:403361641